MPFRWFYTVPLRLRSLFHRTSVDRELDDEMQDHIEHLTSQNLARGMPSREARQAALRAMDGLEYRKEQCRDARRVRPIEDFVRDLRYSLRTMRRSPVFALTAVASLALGIGANTAIFSALDTVLWKPLPVAGPASLVLLQVTRPDGNTADDLPIPFAASLNRSTDIFSGVAGFTADGLSFSDGGRAERIIGEGVTANFFDALGLHMIAGEGFSRGVKTGSWAAETVLSYRFWQRRFGSDRAVIGRVIHLNTYPFVIVGVSQPEFFDLSPGADPELRVPMMPNGRNLPQMALIGSDGALSLVARLQPGVSRVRAEALADAQYAEYVRTYQPRAIGRHLRLLPGAHGWPEFTEPFQAPLLVLSGLVGLVLLIACTNVANMLLARATARRRELAVRCSVGAGRGRLIRQMLAESLLLAFAGGIIGVAVAAWCSRILTDFLPQSHLRIVLDLHPDGRALLFTSILTILTGILFGLVPALQATRGDLAATLKTDSAASIGGLGFRKALVSSQVAFSILLLVTAGMFLRTLVSLRLHDYRDHPERVLLFTMKPQVEIYKPDQIRHLTAELVRRVSAIPGVQAAAIAEAGPLSNRGGGDRPVESPGHDQGKAPSQAYSDAVGPGFFDAVGVPILAGRDFSPADKPGSPPVGIINQSLARSLFGSQNPIGRSFQLPGNRDVPHPFQIIGVAADVRYYDLHRPPQPTYYLTFQDGPPYMPTLHVRTRSPDIAGMIAAVRKEFDAVDKGFPVFDVKTLETRIDGSLSRERMVAELAAAFGVFALLLAAVGLYGVLAYSVTRRTREIGIRLALGSGAPSAAWLIVREALQLVATGCSAGIVLSIAATRWMSGSLFGISAADPLTLAASASLIALIAVLAVAVPALRAAHLDPLIALRSD